MGKPNFSEDFKRDAVHQITVRGYAVREVSERLGVSTYSLYKWMKLYAKAASQTSSVAMKLRTAGSSVSWPVWPGSALRSVTNVSRASMAEGRQSSSTTR